MLGIPETAFADPESGKKLDELQIADWIEGSITFADDEISQNDVVDVLHENYLTSKTDALSAKNEATARVKAVWSELQRRATCLGVASPYRINGQRIERATDWATTPAFAFCLMVALLPVYRKAFEGLKREGYTEQGQIFENVTSASFEALGWQVHPVGWSKSGTDSIEGKVQAVAKFLGVDAREGATEEWTAPKAKDAGLDLICQYVFRDGWGGKPIIFTQCASGENWPSKLDTPRVEIWDKLLDLHTVPVRGLSMPFAVNPDRFRRASFRIGFVLLMDRHRLAVPDKSPTDWIPDALQNQISEWMKSRVEALRATAA